MSNILKIFAVFLVALIAFGCEPSGENTNSDKEQTNPPEEETAAVSEGQISAKIEVDCEQLIAGCIHDTSAGANSLVLCYPIANTSGQTIYVDSVLVIVSDNRDSVFHNGCPLMKIQPPEAILPGMKNQKNITQDICLNSRITPQMNLYTFIVYSHVEPGTAIIDTSRVSICQ